MLKSITYKCIIVINSINNSLRLPVIALIFIMSVATTYAVVMRYVFDNPPLWSLELNVNLLCIVVYLSGGYVLFKDSHIRVDLIYARLSIRGRAILDLVSFGLVAVFCVLLIVEGLDIALVAHAQGRYSLYSMGWPVAPLMMTVPIGGLLLLLQSLIKFGCDIATLVTGREITLWKEAAAVAEKLE